jgi:general secretion pathway protein H
MGVRAAKGWTLTSETGNPSKPEHRGHWLQTMPKSRFSAGFTLVEILVVIVIVATVVSITMLSFGVLGNDRELQTEARRFVSLYEMAQDEASMQSREFGIELMTGSYRFVEYDALAGRWADVPGDDTLRLRPLPDDEEFELYLEDKRILLNNDPAKFDDPDKKRFSTTTAYAPHLLIYSSGDATPFEVRIVRAFDNARVVMRGNALGEVEILSRDEE